MYSCVAGLKFSTTLAPVTEASCSDLCSADQEERVSETHSGKGKGLAGHWDIDFENPCSQGKWKLDAVQTIIFAVSSCGAGFPELFPECRGAY